MSQVYIASATLYNLHAVRRNHMFNVVAHARWSLMKGLNYIDLTENILVFWKSGHPPEVVMYKKWPYWEVQLYQSCKLKCK